MEIVSLKIWYIYIKKYFIFYKRSKTLQEQNPGLGFVFVELLNLFIINNFCVAFPNINR